MSGINRINTGSNMPLSTNLSVNRQTPDLSFGNRIHAGLNATGNIIGSGVAIAGSSFAGGPAILSAAVSSAMTLSNQRSPGAINTTYAGLPGVAGSVSGVVGAGGTVSGVVSHPSDSSGMDPTAAASNFDGQHEKNMALLEMQAKLQNENLTFSSLSNTMKTRHDTAKNSISNLR